MSQANTDPCLDVSSSSSVLPHQNVEVNPNVPPKTKAKGRGKGRSQGHQKVKFFPSFSISQW